MQGNKPKEELRGLDLGGEVSSALMSVHSWSGVPFCLGLTFFRVGGKMQSQVL